MLEKFGALQRTFQWFNMPSSIALRHSVSHCPTFPHIGKKAEKTRKTRHLPSCWPTAEVKKPERIFVQNESNVKTFRKCASNTSCYRKRTNLTWFFWLNKSEQKKHCATQFADRSPDPMIHLGSPATWSKCHLTKIQKDLVKTSTVSRGAR